MEKGVDWLQTKRSKRYLLLRKVSNWPPGLVVYVRSAIGHMGLYERWWEHRRRKWSYLH
jgi:hypothetical protein